MSKSPKLSWEADWECAPTTCWQRFFQTLLFHWSFNFVAWIVLFFLLFSVTLPDLHEQGTVPVLSSVGLALELPAPESHAGDEAIRSRYLLLAGRVLSSCWRLPSSVATRFELVNAVAPKRAQFVFTFCHFFCRKCKRIDLQSISIQRCAIWGPCPPHCAALHTPCTPTLHCLPRRIYGFMSTTRCLCRYEGEYKKKTRRSMGMDGKMDGCAVFFKVSRSVHNSCSFVTWEFMHINITDRSPLQHPSFREICDWVQRSRRHDGTLSKHYYQDYLPYGWSDFLILCPLVVTTFKHAASMPAWQMHGWLSTGWTSKWRAGASAERQCRASDGLRNDPGGSRSVGIGIIVAQCSYKLGRCALSRLCDDD